jgi:hypothetical protein
MISISPSVEAVFFYLYKQRLSTTVFNPTSLIDVFCSLQFTTSGRFLRRISDECPTVIYPCPLLLKKPSSSLPCVGRKAMDFNLVFDAVDKDLRAGILSEEKFTDYLGMVGLLLSV